MEAKLRQLMKHEGINSTRLAEILGIQASGISHIMSGRNKPSFDFLQKLLQRFPQINPDWLLLDKGPMYRDEIKNKSGQPHNLSGGAARTSATGSPISPINPGSATTTTTSSSAEFTGNTAGAGHIGTAGTSVSGVAAGTDTTTAGTSIAAGTSTSAGLFGPDNNDIIPSGTPSGALYDISDASRSAHYVDPSSAGHSTGHSTGHLGGHPEATAGRYPDGGQPPIQPHNAGSPAEHHAVQQSVYQSKEIVRSASIERIVVFYKDKTFSEYQPG